MATLKLSKFLDRYLLVGIDAHFAGNLHGFFGDLAGRKLGVLRQRLGCRLGIGSPAANRRDTAIRLNDIGCSLSLTRSNASR